MRHTLNNKNIMFYSYICGTRNIYDWAHYNFLHDLSQCWQRCVLLLLLDVTRLLIIKLTRCLCASRCDETQDFIVYKLNINLPDFLWACSTSLQHQTLDLQQEKSNIWKPYRKVNLHKYSIHIHIHTYIHTHKHTYIHTIKALFSSGTRVMGLDSKKLKPSLTEERSLSPMWCTTHHCWNTLQHSARNTLHATHCTQHTCTWSLQGSVTMPLENTWRKE